MCGIIGELSSSPVDVEGIRERRDELIHRGPDDEGLYVGDDEHVALGFRRLAIIDPSDAGAQPMPNETDSCWLVFNGEIYNFRELRADLVDRGHEFRSETDSEVVLHGYEEWGEGVVDRLRGMFAFAVWDETAERMFLARDRLGIKPLHYYQNEDRFVFASELKAIVADESVPRTISAEGLANYLRHRYVPAPYTIWEAITKVKPGTYVVVEEPGDVRTERYWDPAAHVSNDADDESVVLETLRETFRDAVQSHLVSDVPVSVLLSGGTDSTLVSAFASEANRDIAAISMGFDRDGVGELEYARLAAQEYDLPQTEVTIAMADVEEMLETLLYYYDEPLADSSIFPTFQLMEAASGQTKVALSGAGGDELFIGYRWHERAQKYRSYEPLSGLFGALNPALVPLVRATLGRVDPDAAQRTAIRLQNVASAPYDRYLNLMTEPFSDEEIASLFGDELQTPADSDPIEAYFDDDMSIKDLQFVDLNTFLIDDVLAKVDRASMAHSLEVRVPFLDHHVVEHALSIDEDLLYRNQEKKYLLNRLGDSVLPKSTLERSKQGFSAPIDTFVERYRSVLANSEAAAGGVLDQATLDGLLETDQPDHRLFKLILFECWYRRWLGELPPKPVSDVDDTVESD